MRSTAAFTALLSIFIAGVMPGYAQLTRRPAGKISEPVESRGGKSVIVVERLAPKTFPIERPDKKFETAPAETRFASVESYTEGQGVWIRWRMQVEKKNAGFRVYRHSKSGLVPVSSFIMGSLFSYGDQVFRDGEYSAFDRKGTSSSSYVVEAMSEEGRTLLSDFVVPTIVSDIGSVKGGDQMRLETSAQKPGENLVESDLNVSPELQAEIASGQVTPDPVKHLEVISQPGVKITSKADGLVRVTRAQLEAGGFDVNSSSTNWQLFLHGVELPIIVGPNADYIEFLGKGLDTLESDIRTYYVINGSSAGRRIPGVTVRRPITSVVSRKFSQTFVREDRKTYTNQVLNGAEENWWGDTVVQNTLNAPTNLNFSLTGVDRTPGTRRLSISFQGFSITPHIMELTLNGNVVGIVNGAGRFPFSGELDVPVEWLLDGNNALAIRASGGTLPTSADIVFIDKLSIDFGRDYIATGSAQIETFTASNQQNVTVLPGTVTLKFTSAQMPQSPILIDVELSGNETSAAQGALYRAALAAHPAINGRYIISGSNASVIITDRLKAPNDPSLSLAVIDTDGTRINAVANSANTLKGVENRLEFFTENYKNATVSGFSSPNFRVFDLTYENHPRLLTNLQPVQTNGTWGPVIPAGRERVLYAVDEGVFDAALSVTPNNPSLLQIPSNAGTMILISHPNFIPQADAWAAYRSGQGIVTKVVDVTDIYDEFNYGVQSSHAVEAFLNYAKNNWQTPPSYVMLFGEAHYDSRNYTGAGYWAMVPTRLVDTLYTETGSDEALSDFNNDGLAEIPIGRASSRDTAGITALFNKTVAWEAALNSNSLNRGALFAYDHSAPDTLGQPTDYDFEGMSNRVMSNLPASMPKTTVRRCEVVGTVCQQTADKQEAIINGLNDLDGGTYQNPGPNAGQFVLNYTGHGTASSWQNTGFFSSFQAPNLTNANYPPVMVALTCLNGYFMGNVNTFAEAMTNANNGGAVAVWASTGLTTPDVQEIIGSRFYAKLSEGNIQRIGDLIADAKAQVPAGADVRLSWALLGDPMLKVR